MFLINLVFFLFQFHPEASWSWCFSLRFKVVIWWLMVCCSLPVQWKCPENSGSFWHTVSSQQNWTEPIPNPPICYPTVRNQDWWIISDLVTEKLFWWGQGLKCWVWAGFPEAQQEGAAARGSHQNLTTTNTHPSAEHAGHTKINHPWFKTHTYLLKNLK